LIEFKKRSQTKSGRRIYCFIILHLPPATGSSNPITRHTLAGSFNLQEKNGTGSYIHSWK
jgi:hypothetical protein